jgi:hypothetical protein
MSDVEKTMWWALGALFTVCAVKFLRPVVIDWLDASCATWRYVAILLGGAVLLGTVSYVGGSEVSVQFAVSIIPMMLVFAAVTAFVGVAYSQLQLEFPALLRGRL